METSAVIELARDSYAEHRHPGEWVAPRNRLHYAMSLGRFRVVLDERPHLAELYLRGTGEGLLAPNLVEMISLATARGIWTSLDTNGTLLYRDRAEELVQVGLGRLRVLMDRPEVGEFADGRYPANRRLPADYFGSPLLENLHGLLAARQVMRHVRRGVDLRVTVGYLLSPRTAPLLADTVWLLGNLGVTDIQVRPRGGRLLPAPRAKLVRAAEAAAQDAGTYLNWAHPLDGLGVRPYLDIDGEPVDPTKKLQEVPA